MVLQNVIIQLVGFIGTGLYLLSYQFKVNKNLFKVQFLAYVFYTLHFILLGAITGGVGI